MAAGVMLCKIQHPEPPEEAAPENCKYYKPPLLLSHWLRSGTCYIFLPSLGRFIQPLSDVARICRTEFTQSRPLIMTL